MTSSLVGSEMCIRDRGKGGQDVCWDSANATDWNCSWCGRDNWGARLAVSYTHLTLPTICSV
eukprot:6043667-Prorocentrum_lima.AAC.1